MSEPRPSCEIHARYSRGCSECHRTEIDAFRAEVAAALRELRTGYTRRADGEGASIEWRAATDLARQELDATITALGLEAEAQEEKCT